MLFPKICSKKNSTTEPMLIKMCSKIRFWGPESFTSFLENSCIFQMKERNTSVSTGEKAH